MLKHLTVSDIMYRAVGRAACAVRSGSNPPGRIFFAHTRLTTLVVFVVSSGLASVAGMILTARLDASTPAAGDTMELDVIAACVIGGTSMSGGVGRIPSVIIGALVMASLDNGMSLINLENYWQFIVKGLVLTLAVWADTMSKNLAD